MTRTEKFTHKGLDFEIRAAAFDRGWTVRVFLNGKPASPAYQASFETAADLNSHGWGNVVDALLALTKEDIENDRLPEIKAAQKTG
jgi:hypothetical protein